MLVDEAGFTEVLVTDEEEEDIAQHRHGNHNKAKNNFYRSLDERRPPHTHTETMSVSLRRSLPSAERLSLSTLLDKLFLEEEHILHKGLAMLTLSALCNGLGNAMVSNSLLSLLHVFALLVGSDWAFREIPLFSSQAVLVFLYILVTQALGFCLGFYSMFGYPRSDALTISGAFLAGLFAWLLFILLSLLPYLTYISLYPSSMSALFVFPALQTVVSCSLIGNIFSTFIAPANSALDYEPLKQVASLLGIAGVNFVFVFWGSFPAFVLARSRYLRRSTVRRWTSGVVLFFVLLFVITGFLAQAPFLLQLNVSRVIDETVPVSCVFSQMVERESEQWQQLWNVTQRRVEGGDAIVLMSEEALLLHDDSEEEDMLEEALRIASLSPREQGVLLGVTYILEQANNPLSKNRFTLVGYDPSETPQGRILWKYDKAHPVPLIESDIEPGKEKLPFVRTNYGHTSGAICFDLDFPQYIAQAGREQVDLFLQPSWTWNAINFRHFEGNALRAVENGFTLFRCSSDGESGIVSPMGKFLHREETGHDISRVATFSLPLISRGRPVFPFFGFIFEYLCVVAGAYFVWTCFRGWQKLPREPFV